MTARMVSGPAGISFYTYTCPLNVDWDGAPKAYGLDRPGVAGQTGLDPWESPARHGSLVNARDHHDWSLKWAGLHSVTRDEAVAILRTTGLIPAKAAKGSEVLSAASQDRLLKKFWDNRTQTPYGHSLENLAGDGRFPVVQIAEMATTMAEGYYVSTTGWADSSRQQWDPHRYLDASTVPYSVAPALPQVAIGDYGLIIRNATGHSTPYVCGDSTNSKKGSWTLGECSGAVYLAMGQENEGDFSFVVFPSSRTGGNLNDANGAVGPVKQRLAKLSVEDANALATHLTSNLAYWYVVRAALTRAGAPPLPTGASFPSL